MNYLPNHVVPALNSNAYFDSLVHEARGDNDGIDLASCADRVQGRQSLDRSCWDAAEHDG